MLEVVGLGALHDLIEDDAHGVDVALGGSTPRKQVHPQQLRCRPQLPCKSNKSDVYHVKKIFWGFMFPIPPSQRKLKRSSGATSAQR